MAARRRRVVWSEQASQALDEAVGYVAQDSLPAARRLLDDALEAARSLDTLSERGPIARETNDPVVHQLLVQHGRFWNYAIRDGMRVPLDGEVAWLLPEGAKPYWRGPITQLCYTFAQ